jgi:RIO-like serine/threonine protein kinase
MAAYNKNKDYLTNFSEPGLIHGDVNQTNVFATENGDNYRFFS